MKKTKREENLSQIKDSESLNFECLKYNLLDNNEIVLLDEVCDPDSNLRLDTPYISPEEFPSLRINPEQNGFFIFDLNIRSIKFFFGNFKLFLSSLNFNFNVINFSETLLDEETLFTYRSLYELPNYKDIHPDRNRRIW